MSAEVLEVGWLCVALAEMTNARERALAAACEGASLNPRDKESFLKSRSARLTLASSAASRRSARARHRLQLSTRACTLSMRHARVHSLHARVLMWHGHRDGKDTGMPWTQGWHEHRDGMDTEMAWTGHSDDMGHSNTQTHDRERRVKEPRKKR